MEKFTRVPNGYNPSEVNQFLDQVINQVGVIIKESKEKQGLSLSEYEAGVKSSFGKRCLAGYKYIQIFPNGNIKICTIDKTYLGNIFDKDFHLYNEPHKCVKKYCPHQFNLIVEE